MTIKFQPKSDQITGANDRGQNLTEIRPNNDDAELLAYQTRMII